MNAGKRFEAKFRKSLALLPGFSLRIHDGGDRVKAKEPADFWYFSTTGTAYLIECKATAQKSFPFARLRDDQRESLAAFASTSGNTRSLIALNFYGADVRKENTLLVLDANDYLAYERTAGRKSIHRDQAALMGWEAPRIAGNLWSLDYLEGKHEI